MKRVLRFVARAIRSCFGVIGSFALWSLWLALVLLFGLQLYVLSLNELPVPDFVLRKLEARLEAAGLRATFARTSFDPTGRILAENVRISLPAFEDPIVTARSIYVRLNPWFLAVGRFEPREIRIVGAAAAVPALFSSSGQPVEIVTGLDATLAPGDKTLVVHQLSGRIAGIVATARGTLVLPRRREKPFTETLAEFVRTKFAAACRHALELKRIATQFEQPELHLELAPSAAGAATVSLTLLARAARLEKPLALRATDVHAHTRLLLAGDNPTSWLAFSARALEMPDDLRARDVHADVYGRLQAGAFFFEPREVLLTAAEVSAAGLSARAISTQVFPRPLPRVDIDVLGRLATAPLAVHAELDLQKRLGRAELAGELAPSLLVPLSERLRVDVRRFFDFSHLAIDHAEVRFGANLAFEKLAARVRVDGINAYGVAMSAGRATLELDRDRLLAPAVFARVGENFARGSYEQDLRTREFRFLLEGRLRPMEISPWFRDWWRNFFQQLEFPVAPPDASVDVRGIWREGHRTSVFVFADVPEPVLRGTAFDRVRTRLFIRPGFYDALELFATRGEGFADGRFTFVTVPGSREWTSFDLAADSSLDLGTLGSILGPERARVLQAFKVKQPPALKLDGRFTSAASPEGVHQHLRIDALTKGEFQFHEFPLHDASFVATLKDGEIMIDDFEALVAGGVASGHAHVWGPDDQRRLGFDLTLDDASLGQLVGTVQGFFARQKGLPPPPAGKFVQEKANVKLNLGISAEGGYHDPLSFRGEGSATLAGPEIAEISLLGSLSELLKFTALRFTEAQTNFKIEGPKITFSEVKISGPSAAIEARGSYSLSRSELDFNAKIFPFQESANLLKSVVGAVLTPLSNAFEVKLGGSLEKPQWAFVISPTNLLRSLTPEAAAPPAAPASPATSPPPTPPPSAP